MKKTAILLVLCMLSVMLLSSAVSADEAQAANPEVSGMSELSEVQEDSYGTADAEVQDDLVTTRHTAVIRGEEIAYTVTTGTMVLTTGGVQGEFFFRAYTRDGVDDVSSRPVTFAFNGGPGSCSYYLEMGCLGPRRAEMTENGHTLSLPPAIVDNENSLLDITDLVFIDAIGTGFSRPVDESTLSEFIGYDNDVRSFGDFIRQYVNQYGRWGSKKYIAGESYGTTRAVGICQYLSHTYSIDVNGLMLISTLNDFSTAVPTVSNETSYGLYLPTFAADAWYHNMLDDTYQTMELEDYLEEVKEFVSTEYIPFLFLGNRITKEEKMNMAEKLSSYLGLSVDFILEKNLRITLEDFCARLLYDQNLIIGRLDGRYTGPVTSGSIGDGDNDPSSIESGLMFGNAFYKYLTTELGYQTDLPYIPSNGEVNMSWTSPTPAAGWIGGYFSQEDIIYECMSKNPYLKVWVLCGYYDAATPFYAAEWTYSHVFLHEESLDNLAITCYPSGHMFYLEKNSYDQFRQDAEKWYLE